MVKNDSDGEHLDEGAPHSGRDDSIATFLADGKTKIDVLFADTPDHVSASIGDVKALGMLILEHITSPKPAETELDDESPEADDGDVGEHSPPLEPTIVPEPALPPTLVVPPTPPVPSKPGVVPPTVVVEPTAKSPVEPVKPPEKPAA